MLNMLFISDSPKSVYLKSFLQPKLKVIIDVVTDFDQGLKYVFEKRPNTVFIQEQIGGVTGESVARHIQMLLGGGAPGFILMHEGSAKIKTIRGLFDHLVDLNQPSADLTEGIQNTLKELLGSQWYKIYIPSESSSASTALPSAAILETPDVSNDQLDALLKEGKPPVAAEKNAVAASNEHPEAPFFQSSDEEYANLVSVPIVKPPTIPKSPTQSSPVSAASSPVAPAGFRISQDKFSEEDPIPDELLLAFEQNYHPPSIFLKRSTILIAIAILLFGAAGWYVVRRYSQLTASLKERVKPADAQRAAGVPPVKSAPAAPVQPQLPTAPAAVSAEKPVPKPTLPKCIPQGGLDGSYAAGHPGWQRYIGPQSEFRVFSKSGELKAIQVLAAKGAALSESFIREITGEFVGSPEYLINSRETKNGVLILSGSITNRGNIRIYKKDGTVRAFVVSRN